MTTKRDKKDEPKAAKRPKLTKETVRDLTPDRRAGEAVRAGARNEWSATCGSYAAGAGAC